ncbi:hypothetical protein [Thermosporothrix hazakensis]|uniref:hypothetical protein n=1 Tax=Thermosporothrix hazakensis TaxID=644383 RepID=UPI000DADA1A5|nr:hypothetical protein [Thermosporothrix hazakensis]
MPSTHYISIAPELTKAAQEEARTERDAAEVAICQMEAMELQVQQLQAKHQEQLTEGGRDDQKQLAGAEEHIQALRQKIVKQREKKNCCFRPTVQPFRRA